MAQTFTGRKRVRKVFGHVREVGQMPNLIEVQKVSYDQFLLMDAPKGGRPNEGLQAVFKSVFPIKDFADTAHLEFVKYEYEPPKYDLDECRQRGQLGQFGCLPGRLRDSGQGGGAHQVTPKRRAASTPERQPSSWKPQPW